MSAAFGSFCAFELVALLTWWLLFRLTTGRHAISLAASSVYVRPRWLPIGTMQALHAHRLTIFALAPTALAISALAPSSYIVRCMLTIAISIYHLVESSASGRHGEYPLLYITWAWLLLPDEWAHAACFGVMVHFVFSSGVAKLIVGGTKWMGPHTMKAYLDLYLPSKSNPPLSRRLNAEIADREWVMQLIGVGTIALECVLIPSCLLLPPAYRPLGALAMLSMHIGIALCLSLQVGLRFLTTLPCYLLGFICNAPIGSAPWALAVAIGMLPSILSLATGSLLPDEWPLAPFTLFMFDGEAARRIASDFMTSDTRLVLTTAEPPPRDYLNPVVSSDLVGLRVVRHELLSDSEEAAEPMVVHDGVMRVIAFTTVRAGLHSLLSEGAAMPLVLSTLTAWLEEEHRLVESATGLPVRCAYFVRVSRETGRVVEVLCGPHEVDAALAV